MSVFTLNGAPLQKARATIPRLYVWEGSVTVAGTLEIAKGAAVALVLGDLTLAGYVVDGGTFPGASESTYLLAGGAAGWTKVVPAWSKQAPEGLRLVDVVAALATDARERFDLTSLSSTAIIGDHWQRPEGIASTALRQLLPDGWRIDPDGVTRAGVRPLAPLPMDLEFAVEDQDRGRRAARVTVRDDRVSALLPGAVVTAGNLAAPIVVAETTIHADRDAVWCEVLGEGGIVEMLAALVYAFSPKLPYAYSYRVTEADTGAPTLEPVRKDLGLPVGLAIAKVYGLPGASATLASGAVVALAFLDGSPACPVAVSYLPGVLPAAVGLDGGSVTVGGAAGAGAALARAAEIVSFAGGVVSAFAALTPPVTIAPLAATVAATKARGV